MKHNDEFSADELLALEEWQAPFPPRDLAGRVVDSMRNTGGRPGFGARAKMRGFWALPIAAAFGLLFAGWLIVQTGVSADVRFTSEAQAPAPLRMGDNREPFDGDAGGFKLGALDGASVTIGP